MIVSPRAACPMDCESGNLNPYEVNGKAFKIKTHKSDSLFPNTPCLGHKILIKVRFGIILHSPAISVILKHWQSVLRKAGSATGTFTRRVTPMRACFCRLARIRWGWCPRWDMRIGDDPEGVRMVTIGRQKAMKDLVRYHD